MIESTNFETDSDTQETFELSVVLSRFQGIDNPNQIYNDSMIQEEGEFLGLERSTNKPYELTHKMTQ